MSASTIYCDLVTERLQELHWSLLKLSTVSGVPYSTLRNHYEGSIPTLEVADKVLYALGIEMTLGGVAHYTTKEATP